MTRETYRRTLLALAAAAVYYTPGALAQGENAADPFAIYDEPASSSEASEESSPEAIAVEPLRAQPEASLAAPPNPEEPGSTKLEQIQVTGSRIRRTDLESAAPVTVVTRADIELTGQVNIGDILQELPSAGSALNRNFNNGGSGTTEIDLRNLGSNRVLVLVNGKRWINGTSFANLSAVDLNTIPTSIIERIEILKDGASAIYGSDAITGVVNIITRKDFDGLELSSDVSSFDDGGGLIQRHNFSFGTTGSKTSFYGDVSFARQDALFAGERDISSVPKFGVDLSRGSIFTPQGSVLFVPTEATKNALQAGAPGNNFCPELVAGGQLAGAGLPPELRGPLVNIAPGVSLCDIILRPGETIGAGDFGQPALVASRYMRRNPGTDNYNFAPINYLATPFEQGTLFTQLSHQFLDNLGLRVQFVYNISKTERNLAETPLLFGDLLFPPFNDIFIDETNIFNPFGQDIGRHDGQGTDADALGLGPGTGIVGRRFTELGPRFLGRNKQTFFVNTQFDGDFMVADQFVNWDIGYAIGRSRGSNEHRGDLNIDKVRLAIGPNIDCMNATGCVPLNLFGGAGTITQEMLDYVSYTASSFEEQQVEYANGNIAMALPLGDWLAGPMGIAVGFEFRTEDFAEQVDPFVEQGISSTNIRRSTRGGTRVGEGYVELELPILRDLPFAQSLDINLAGRYTSYGTFDPKTTGKIGLRYRPIDDLALRGSLSESFRAPNITDLFLGSADAFPQLSDPCFSGTNGTPRDQGTDVDENCDSEGVPDNVTQLGTQLLTQFGGNPNLDPETAAVLTAGIVYSPSWLADFNMTVDYFDIDVDDFIGFLGPGFILDQCYNRDPDSARPETCDFVVRNSGGSIQSIQARSFNFARIATSGVDLTFDYRLPIEKLANLLPAGAAQFLDNPGTWRLVFDSTYLIDYVQELPNADGSVNRQELQGMHLGDSVFSRFKANLGLVWLQGNWNASWTARYVRGVIEPCNDGIAPPLQTFGVCSNPDTDLSDQTDDSTNRLGSVVYNNFRVGYNIAPLQLNIALGVLNALDKDPPISQEAFANSFAATVYEIPGRQVFLQLNKRF